MTIIEEITQSYTLRMTPYPTPRVRARIVKPKGKEPFVSMYNPGDYTDWKNEISHKVHGLNIKKRNWNTLNAVFFIPIPKSYSNKLKMSLHGTLHEQKPDWDNYAKGLQDGIQMTSDLIEKHFLISPISDDSSISSAAIRKIWINDPIGKIVFTLARISIDPLYMMAI